MTGNPYRLVATEEYESEFESIAAGVETLSLSLEKGAYFTLQRDPYKGHPASGTTLWVMRQWVLRGVLLVDIFYRIDADKYEVSLVSIRAVDLTRL